ncbi:hypothetical protein [Persicobacter psychrovividus]|uniref:Uncharacterized protein n=1 Tax=Persicobacter psychrovividus TaxID=387638 RepID=A0ABM7VLA2_9BACT|nr:hypothetical protein PEPS_40550 [Persicobacter psychrovividus]
MKAYLSIILGAVVLFSCNSPQEKTIQQVLSPEDQIAANADQHYNSFKETKSYPFSFGGDSQYEVSRYDSDSFPTYMQVRINAGDYGHEESQFYLDRNNQLLLITQNGLRRGPELPRGGEFYERKVYITADTIRVAKEKTASHKEDLQNAKWETWKPKSLTEGQFRPIWMLKHNYYDAVAAQGNFDWHFEQIQKISDDISLIVLNGKEHVQSSFFVHPSKATGLLKELIDKPEDFKGQKIEVQLVKEELNGDIVNFAKSAKK